jgi:hypothetical protein
MVKERKGWRELLGRIWCGLAHRGSWDWREIRFGEYVEHECHNCGRIWVTDYHEMGGDHHGW